MAKAQQQKRGLRRLIDQDEDQKRGVVAIPGLGERLGQLVSMYESQKEAAASIGRAPETLQNWKKGRMPFFGDVARMAREKGVRLDWLATGDGPVMSNEREAALDAEYAFIPRYEVRAGAGFGQPVLSEEVQGFLAFRQDWIRQRLRRNPANLVVIEAFGDSMYPTISDGDVMLVDISEDRVRGSAIYVVGAGNEAVVKRVELRLDGSLLVKSDNPSYEPIILPRDDTDELRVIGKVVWTGGLV